MMKIRHLLLVPCLLLSTAFIFAKEDHGHSEHGQNEHEDHANGRIHLDEDIAEQVGIVIASAGPATIQQQILAYGKLNTGPENLSHIRARYAGLIQSVQVNIGDSVQVGDLLAEIESNESLRNYQIHAPISGVIVERRANTGEVAREHILFSVANFDTLWVELRIYPSQHDKVKPGQAVHFHANEKQVSGKISHIIPSLDKPYQLARAKIDNSELALLPGLLVEGNIAIAEDDVALAVRREAVQSINGTAGVFVKEGAAYHFQALILGDGDHDVIEVIDGLSVGTSYVSKNSYLLKAHLEKSEAEHHH